MIDFSTYLNSSDLPLLTEGSIFERVRRDSTLTFDPDLANAALVYDPLGRKVLERVHREYIEIGIQSKLNFIAFTDTWRANPERVERSQYRDRQVNADCANFLCEIRNSYSRTTQIFVAGQIGCKGDAYNPNEALTADEAYNFHRPQIKELADTDVDFLFAATLPALSEAEGIAHAMSETSLPYILSFVIRPNGTILDGTPISDVIKLIDGKEFRSPIGYYVNCVHPTVFVAALGGKPDKRVVGLQANTSRKSPEDIDGSEELDSQNPKEFADDLWRAFSLCGLRIGGGCCGTDARHISEFAQRMKYA